MPTDLALQTSEFETEVLQSQVPVLVDFWAAWCGPCRQIAPAVEAIAQDYAGKAKVFKVDVDAEPSLAERYGVMSIPTLLIFKNGQLADQIVGAVGKDHIKASLDRAIG